MPAEMKKFFSLLICKGIVNVPTHERYWSTRLCTMTFGLEILPLKRFKALLAMIHVVDPISEKGDDKLRKVTPFINYFKDSCLKLHQRYQNLAVDERLIKSKHRSGICQYVKNKPVKFGVKLWVIVDSRNGYTCDFNVYAGKDNTTAEGNSHGLGYNTVIKLSKTLLNQEYHIFFDNFYTSSKLVCDLFDKVTPSLLSQKMNKERAFYVYTYVTWRVYISTLLSFNVTQCNIETQYT